MAVQLPEGLRVTITAYCISDGADIEVVYRAPESAVQDDYAALASTAITHVNRLLTAMDAEADARLMTAAEIEDYLTRNEDY